jgi:hypothetical protein
MNGRPATLNLTTVVPFVLRDPRHRGGNSRAVRRELYVNPLVEAQSHDVVPTRNEKNSSRIVGLPGRLSQHNVIRQQMRDRCSPLDS